MGGQMETINLHNIPQPAFQKPTRVSNYSYPHHSMSGYGVRCASLGSDCSVPGMVEDHGSDISTEDDYQYHGSGTELWDSFWQARSHEGTRETGGRSQSPILLTTQPLYRQPLMANQGVKPPTRKRTTSQTSEASQTSHTSQKNQDVPSWPLPLPTSFSPKRRAKNLPKASYSLFPPTTDCQPPPPIQSLVRPRRSSLPKEPRESTSTSDTIPVALGSPSPAQVASFVSRPLPGTPSPGGISRLKTPAASTITRSPSYMKSVPKTPDQQQRRISTRRPSVIGNANVRKRSVSRTPTQLKPLLPSAHRQTIIAWDKKPSCHQSQIFRVSSPSPLIPKPKEAVAASPPTPNISVFEDDSDSEDDGDSTADDAQLRGLARRLVRGLISHSSSHHHLRGSQDRNGSQKNIAGLLHHQRSASDSASSTPIRPKTPAMETGARPRRGRAVTTSAVGGLGGGRPPAAQDSAYGEASPPCDNKTKSAKEPRSHPWLSRQSSELFFGRLFLGRKGD